MSQINSFEDLEVWKKSHSLVLKTYRILNQFPKDEWFRLRDQLLRGIISIPANIAEGKGRSSQKEYAHFVSIARGSAQESKYFIILAKDLDFINTKTADELIDAVDEVSKMLNGLLKSLRG